MVTLSLMVSPDAVILGLSSIKHLVENLKSANKGPLHEGENFSNWNFHVFVCVVCGRRRGRGLILGLIVGPWNIPKTID